MILWTFQPYSVYEQVMQNGEYICDPNMSPMLNIDDVVTKLEQQITDYLEQNNPDNPLFKIRTSTLYLLQSDV